MLPEFEWSTPDEPLIGGGQTQDGEPWYFESRQGEWSLHIGRPTQGTAPTECVAARWCVHGKIPPEVLREGGVTVLFARQLVGWALEERARESKE